MPKAFGSTIKHLTVNQANIDITVDKFIKSLDSDPALKDIADWYFKEKYTSPTNELFEMHTDKTGVVSRHFQHMLGKVKDPKARATLEYAYRLSTEFYTGGDFAQRALIIDASYKAVNESLKRNSWKAKNPKQAMEKANKVLYDMGLMGVGKQKVDRMKRLYTAGIESGDMSPFIKRATYNIVDVANFHYTDAKTPLILKDIRAYSKTAGDIATLSSWPLYDVENMRTILGSRGSKVDAKVAGRISLKVFARVLSAVATFGSLGYSLTPTEREKKLGRDSYWKKSVMNVLFNRMPGYRMLNAAGSRATSPFGIVASSIGIYQDVYKRMTDPMYDLRQRRKGKSMLRHFIPTTTYKVLESAGSDAWDYFKDIVDNMGGSDKQKREMIEMTSPLLIEQIKIESGGKIKLDEDFEIVLDDNE